MKLVAAFVRREPAAQDAPGLCDEARFLLRLVAAHHGFCEADMLNRLVAAEAQAIGIGRLETVRRARPDLEIVAGAGRRAGKSGQAAPPAAPAGDQS